MSTTLQLHGLRLPTRIGVYDWEKEAPQTLVYDLDLTLQPDMATRAAHTDALADTIDYAALETALEHWLPTRHYELLEALAPAMAAFVLAQHAGIAAVRVAIGKPGALRFAPMVRIVHETSRTGGHHA